MPGPKVDRSKYTLGSPQTKKRLTKEASTVSSSSSGGVKVRRRAATPSQKLRRARRIMRRYATVADKRDPKPKERKAQDLLETVEAKHDERYRNKQYKEPLPIVEKRVNKRYDKLFDALSPYLPKGTRQPKIKVAKTPYPKGHEGSAGIARKGGNIVLGQVAGRDFAAKGKRGKPLRQSVRNTIIHETAHTAQREDQTHKQTEGGATAFARRVEGKIAPRYARGKKELRRQAIAVGKPNAGYDKWADQLNRNKGKGYVMKGQFNKTEPRSVKDILREKRARKTGEAEKKQKPTYRGKTHFTPDQAATLLYKVGATKQEAETLSAYLMGESGGNPRADNPTSGASGLFQIMMPLHADKVRKHGGNVWDPVVNARTALQILREQGVGAWEAAPQTPGRIKAGAKRGSLATGGGKRGGLWRGKKAPFSTGSLTADQAAVTPAARKLAKKIAGISGEEVTLISGVRPGAVTTTGNVSDHASGNALDIHALDQTSSGGGTAQDKRRGDRIAKGAMIAAGIPAKKADQYLQGDGPVEVNTYHNGYRVQILWRTDTGGNHHNHVHVGIRAEDGSGTSVVSGGVGGPLAASTGSSSGGTPVRGGRASNGRRVKRQRLARVQAAYSSPAESSSSDSELDELEKRYSAVI